MNDMEKCFYEPAELSVVDEGKGEPVQAGFPCGTSR